MTSVANGRMSLEERNRIIYSDFPTMDIITVETREQNSKRTFTGGVRINNAQYRTAAEDQKYRQESLRREFP